jgi:hypothetical protein
MMKTTLFSILVAIAMSFGFANKTFAQSSGISFTVSNQQITGLGTVTVATPSGDYYLAVLGMSSDTLATSDTATSITINGQTVPQGLKAIVTLASGTQVAVIWISPCNVVVVDEKEIG